MEEERLSRLLMKLNKERIIYKSLSEERASKDERLKKIIGYVLSGNIRYIADKIMSSKYSNIEYKNEQIVNRTITKDEKIVIYTVMFGKYDNLSEPIYITKNCDYYILTDQDIPTDSVWKKYPLKENIVKRKKLSNLEMARYFKTHPHDLFREYKYSMFIDANVQIVTDMRPVFSMLGDNFIAIHSQPGRDCIYQEANAVVALKKGDKNEVARQIKKYKDENFPSHYGLFQTNIVVREHNDRRCIHLMEKWWSEMVNHTKRDQLSFTYCLWKMGYGKDDVSILGANSLKNPRFRINPHI